MDDCYTKTACWACTATSPTFIFIFSIIIFDRSTNIYNKHKDEDRIFSLHILNGCSRERGTTGPSDFTRGISSFIIFTFIITY